MGEEAQTDLWHNHSSLMALCPSAWRLHRGSGITPKSCLHRLCSLIPVPTSRLPPRSESGCSPALALPKASYPSANPIQTCLPCDHTTCNISLWKKSHGSSQILWFKILWFLSLSLFFLFCYYLIEMTQPFEWGEWIQTPPGFITL